MRQPTRIVLQSLTRSIKNDWRPIAASELVLTCVERWKQLLWKLCVWARLQFDRPVQETSFQAINIDGDYILSRLTMNQYDIDAIWGRRANHLIIGAKEAELLWGEAARNQFFAGPIEFLMARGGHPPEWRGLKIVVVPWIESGAFCLPDLESQ